MSNPPSQLAVQTISVSLPPTLVTVIQNVAFVAAVIRDFLLFIYAILSGKITFVDLHDRLQLTGSDASPSNGTSVVNGNVKIVPTEDIVEAKTGDSSNKQPIETKETVSNSKTKTEQDKQPWKGCAVRELCQSIAAKDFDHVFE